MKCLLLLTASVLALVIAPIMGTGRERPAKPDSSRALDIPIDHDVEATELPHAMLADILGGTGIPAGVAQLDGCSGVPSVSLKVSKGATIREVLDAFVLGNPRYQWLPEGGVVNLLPKSAPLSLLDTGINNFQLSTTSRQMTANAILDSLVSLPGVYQRAAELEFQPRVMKDFFLGVHKEHPEPMQPVPIALDLRNVSLREAFNSVVGAYGNTIWIYVEHECGAEKMYWVGTETD